jgi:hypothetical protein
MGTDTGDRWLTDASGTTIPKASFPSTGYSDPDPLLTLTEDVYEHFKMVGESGETGRRLKWKAGTNIRTSERDFFYSNYSAATITSLTPATGAAAGGTAIVIRGTGFDGASGVTFGGTAGTSFSVVNDETIHVTTPAKTAGTYDVIVQDDAGNVTDAASFIYT